MKKISILTLTAFAILSLLAISAIAQDKLPADKAGEIGQPSGKIAFVRDGSIWAMKADGSEPGLITDVRNADGRLSWSPDNSQIAFTRSGQVDLKGPDNLGGRHKVYDIFIAYMDSAYANNRQFWFRLTNDLGNRDPQWDPKTGKIIFWKDMNANKVNSFAPNYQICTMDGNGDYIKILRKDWQNQTESFLTSPSMNQNGDLAFVYFYKQRQVGLVTTHIDKIMGSMDEFKVQGEKNKTLVAPSWSPDGKWLSYIVNDIDKQGLFITTADLSERYLITIPPVGTYLNTFAASFSPDSKWLTFSTTDGSIWIVDITGNGLRRVTSPGANKAPAWSN